MIKIKVSYNGKQYECEKYEKKDEKDLIERYFFWRVSTFITANKKLRKPPIPEDFSEPFCCYVGNLVHKRGAGPDAFKLDSNGNVIRTIEIKATTTDSGFQGVKKYSFDELYWLDLSEFKQLKYKIYKFTHDQIPTSARCNLGNLDGELISSGLICMIK